MGKSGFGAEYEILVPAYFSLILHNREDIEDFCFKTNESKLFKNMDDIIVEMITKEGVKTNFAFQLKHKEENDKFLVPGFETSGEFCIEKYCARFKEMDEYCKTYNFVLFSNIKFDKDTIKEVKHFNMIPRKYFEGSIFNTSDKDENAYRFEININTPVSDRVDKEDYKKFLERFSLFCGQKNYQELEEEIESMLPNNAWLKYIHMFRKWHHDEFADGCIDKKTVSLHLVAVLTSSCLVRNYHLSTNSCSSVQLFEEAVKEFDVTIIREPKYFLEYLEKGEVHELENYSPHQIKNQLEQYIQEYKISSLEDFETKPEEIMENCFIRLAKKYKFLKKSAKEMTSEIKLKILNYIFMKPLILHFNESTKDLIYEVVEMCQHLNIKVVLLGTGVEPHRLKNFRVLEKLTDLENVNPFLFEVIRTRCNNTKFEDTSTGTLYQLLKRHKQASVPDADVYDIRRRQRT